MNLTDLVPSIELCKLIPEGEFEDSALYWGLLNKYLEDVMPRECGYCPSFQCGQKTEIICPAPTLQEILKKIAEIKELSTSDHLSINGEKMLESDPEYNPSIKLCAEKNRWISKRWANSIWEEFDYNAANAALRTYFDIKNIEVTMPCINCGTWLHQTDKDQHVENVDNFSVVCKEICPKCGLKYYEFEPLFHFLYKETLQKYFNQIDTPIGVRLTKKQSEQ